MQRLRHFLPEGSAFIFVMSAPRCTRQICLFLVQLTMFVWNLNTCCEMARNIVTKTPFFYASGFAVKVPYHRYGALSMMMGDFGLIHENMIRANRCFYCWNGTR